MEEWGREGGGLSKKVLDFLISVFEFWIGEQMWPPKEKMTNRKKQKNLKLKTSLGGNKKV